MSTKACRDCGNLVPAAARGCPQCALNLEAEGMIDRFIQRRLLPGLVLVVVVGVGLAYYLLR